jgi:site-specific recombinase XerD
MGTHTDEKQNQGGKKRRKRKPLKRANGHGSVYKLSGRRRRPWIARVTVGWEMVKDKKTGEEKPKQIYQTIGCFAKKEDAIDALNMHRINPVSPKANITLKELYEEWSESKYRRISKSTADNYRAAWNYYAKCQNAKFKDIRTMHLQSIVDYCQEKGMSRSTMEKVKALAVMLYNYAIQNDIINKNYADFIQLPDVEKEKRERFSDLDIQKMIDNADTVEWVDTILILIYSGMRISEMLQLTKFNIDLKNQIITGGIKTEAGKDRIIPIHPKILKYITAWYNKNGETLFFREGGKKITARYYREQIFYPTLDKLGIKRLTPHSCRHTFASLMANAGADPLYIQRIIGHKKYSTTADIYTHTDVEDLRKAITMI